MNKISSLEERISSLITLVNECAKNGIKLPANTEKYGYRTGYRSHNFYADGIYHHVGFMGRKKEMCNYIGIYNGGFSTVDMGFLCEWKRVFLKHRKKIKIIRYDVSNLSFRKISFWVDIF